MSEKRLASSGDSFVDLTEMQIVDLLNKLSDENTRLHKKVDEQQATIEEQERKIRKCEAEVGRQLKQIIDLQDELNECRARPTLATDERGVVKVEYR